MERGTRTVVLSAEEPTVVYIDGKPATIGSAEQSLDLRVSFPDCADLCLVIESSTPNGGEHCSPPGNRHNVCFRCLDGSCAPCGYEALR